MDEEKKSNQSDIRKSRHYGEYLLNEDSPGSLIGYSYQQVASESAKVLPAKTEPEKVTNMVGTFWAKYRDVFQVAATHATSEKVVTTVNSFLN